MDPASQIFGRIGAKVLLGYALGVGLVVVNRFTRSRRLPLKYMMLAARMTSTTNKVTSERVWSPEKFIKMARTTMIIKER